MNPRDEYFGPDPDFLMPFSREGCAIILTLLLLAAVGLGALVILLARLF